ncbi:hypothetical protein CKO35_03995 [Ectothiorhodospira shaposhnikovii]|uniref:hypothetical protein n=1 Tax=Ectothiorhodospira shaposhnikovii TaxID=1054 RepID=UPI0019077D72|nr:hypothetical protein [Ectothiorhodospira shaposhnikovii]MBK1672470.1 hypothetical protein [Ectothiorhodospira shaposhnikovii]
MPVNDLRQAATRWLPWIAILGIALALRTWQLRTQLLADDEWHALHQIMAAGPAHIFTHFGHADHSIPLTLLYQWLAQGPGLTEWTLRLPLLIAGLVSVMLIPWLLRGLARTDEKLILAGLLAISPLLVYYSRTARPYALSVLLAVAAILAFRWWWLQGDRRWALAYSACTALAAWLHPITLAATAAPFAYQGLPALIRWFTRQDAGDLLRLIYLGLATLALLLILLGPPLYMDFQSLSGKSGVHQVTWSSFGQTLSLFAGSAHLPLLWGWLGLAALGLGILARRDPDAAAYLGFILVIATALVIHTDGAWIHHPLVLARYLLPLLPLLLIPVAIALAGLTRPLPVALRAGLLAGILALFYLGGPLPAQYHQGINQFTGHMAYQFDYDWERNLYNRQLARETLPDFHHRLAEIPPGQVTLIQAPWYIEWHWNNWYLQQRVHQQHIRAGMVSGLCAEQAFGEYSPDQHGIRLRHMVHLGDLAPGSGHGDYLVIDHRPPREGARPIPGFGHCVEILRQRLGDPIYRDEELEVFDLSGSD